MIVKDLNKFRALFMLKGLEKKGDIAKALDVSPNTVTRWFDSKPMLPKQARQIAVFLDASLDDLFVSEEAKVLA